MTEELHTSKNFHSDEKYEYPTDTKLIFLRTISETKWDTELMKWLKSLKIFGTFINHYRRRPERYISQIE